MRIFHYGCANNSKGHYVHTGKGLNPYGPEKNSFLETNPWGYEVDSGLCPKGPEIAGRALIHHKDGWTAMSFWDRSVDTRGKSNSNFFAEGTHTFDEMVAIAKEHFTEIMARFTFPIVEAK